MKSLKIKNQNYNAKFKNNFDIFYLSFFILIFTFYILTLSLEASASTINKSPNYLGSSNGLVGYWTMDGNSVNWATGAVTDSSGRGNTGTITNMATSTAIGKIGQALSFDGVNDYMRAVITSVPTEFTVTAWIKLNEIGREQHFAEFTSNQFYVASNNRLGTGIWGTAAGITTLAISTWYHATITRTPAGAIVLYLNGSQEGTGTGAVNPASPFVIGDFYNLTGNYQFNGLIDDVRVYNRALSAEEIQTLFNSGAAKFNVSPTKYLTSGLVGYWTMDGNNVNWATGAVTDSSGRGNTGTITNMATSTAIGKIGQALSFDGVNDYMRAVITSVPTEFTVTAWIKLNEIGREQHFAEFTSNQFYVASNNRLGTGIWGTAAGITTLAISTWYHATITRTPAGAIVLYLNGSQEGTGTGAVNPASPFVIGDFYNLTGNYQFNGLIDDVRVYNRALSAEEIQTLFNSGAAKFNVSPTKYLTSGLVGYWTMDGNNVNWATGAVTDSSGRG
ncbi:hypothetical protein A2819_02300, partial [Candidatus Azambacteria bacterium RIFCSPHIGHO2_01_FULL_40_24]